MAFLVSDDVLARVRRLDLPWNRHGLDPYGTSQVDVARMFTILGFLYRRYFRVRAAGIDNIPKQGRAMLIGNHSGGWAVDALVGKQTRQHADLDVWIDACDTEGLFAAFADKESIGSTRGPATVLGTSSCMTATVVA